MLKFSHPFKADTYWIEIHHHVSVVAFAIVMSYLFQVIFLEAHFSFCCTGMVDGYTQANHHCLLVWLSKSSVIARCLVKLAQKVTRCILQRLMHICQQLFVLSKCPWALALYLHYKMSFTLLDIMTATSFEMQCHTSFYLSPGAVFSKAASHVHRKIYNCSQSPSMMPFPVFGLSSFFHLSSVQLCCHLFSK